MNNKTLNGFLIIIIIILFLSIYWFIPINYAEYNLSTNSNFSIIPDENVSLQFYPNMRFPDKEISYRIEDCPLQRQNDMEWAFEILEDETELSFYPVSSNERITITCEEKTRYEGRLFIAGEGGPTNITIAGDLNVIEAGKIMLMKDSDCQRPNIAIHELLHVLGFDHSANPNNIMYGVSRCDQTIGEDIISFIDTIYEIPSNPDLIFENSSASMHGRYLDINFSVRNNGLKYADSSVVKVIADNKEVEEIKIPDIDIGYGRRISIENLWINQIDVKTIEFRIDSNFEELSKENNIIQFELKK